MIIIINGCIASGKTETGKELKKILPNSTFIDVDHILGGHNEKDMPKFAKLVIQRLDAMIDKGNELAKENKNAIFAYCIFEDYLPRMNEKFKYPFKIFTLDPSMEVCLEREFNKINPRLWKKENIEEFYEKGIQKLSQSRAIINNSELTPLQTAQRIKMEIS